MRFEREKPPDTAAATDRLVLIRCNAIRLNADITKIEVGQNLATAINESSISGPVHGSRSVRAVQGIGNHLPALSYRNRPQQLGTDSTWGQDRTRQWVIRYQIEPTRTSLRVGAQRQQHITSDDRHVVIKQIVYCGETQIYRGVGSHIAGLPVCEGDRAILQLHIKTRFK